MSWRNEVLSPMTADCSLHHLRVVNRPIYFDCTLFLWWPLLSYGNSYKASCVRPG